MRLEVSPQVSHGQVGSMNFFLGIDIVDSRAVCSFVDGKNLPRMNQSINPLSIVLFPSIVAKAVDSRKVSLP